MSRELVIKVAYPGGEMQMKILYATMGYGAGTSIPFLDRPGYEKGKGRDV